MNKLTVVLARYKEDVSWLDKLNHDFCIVNKGPDDINEKYKDKILKIPYKERGREAQGYVSYIIENYDNLPDYLVFTQANPFDHCPPFLDIINNFKFDVDYLRLGHLVHEYHKHPSHMSELFFKFSDEIVENLTFPGGQQFLVKKEKILLRPKRCYQDCLAFLDEEDKEHFSGRMERIWEKIFDENIKTKEFNYV